MPATLELPVKVMPINSADSTTSLRDIAQRAYVDGVIILLSIGKRSWTTRATTEDLGVVDLAKNIKPGRKYLLPEDALKAIDRIEGQARRSLDIKSVPFGRKSRAKVRFVPNRNVGNSVLELEESKRQFFIAIGDLILNYEALKARMQADYPEQWPALSQAYPEVSQIRDAYYFEWELAQTTFPSQFEKIDVRQFFHQEAMAETHRAELTAILENQRRDAARNAEEFVEEIVRGLRGEVVEVFQNFLQNRKDDKKANKTSFTTLSQIIDRINQVDFLNDAEFKNQLEVVRAQLLQPHLFKDNDEAMKALTTTLQETIDFAAATTETAAVTLRDSYFKRKLTL